MDANQIRTATPEKNTAHDAGPVHSRLVLVLGSLCVFGSAFCFYFSTVVIRWARTELPVDVSFFAFFRFLLGFFFIGGVMIATGRGPRPSRYHLLVGRTVTNAVAVYCFYKCVSLTSLAEGNILNMTYPIFVAIISWILLRQQRDKVAIVMVGVALVGIWMILSPGEMRMNLYSLWGLASGISAAVSIVYLNVSRQWHDSETVLFYMFGLGAVLIYAVFHDKIFVPNAREFYYLMVCGISGVGGQYLLTIGFKFVTAVEGGVISSTRILLAAVLGPWIASDPPLGLSGWIGALLIFTANVILTWRKSGRPKRPATS